MRLILFLLFFLTILNIHSGTNDLRFNHYDIHKGLSHNTVNCVFQDQKGFMWFGTNYGLNRFDGTSIKTYLKNEQQNSISNNIIYIIREDTARHTLWLGTDNGIVLFDLKTESFHTLPVSTSDGIPINGDIKDFYFDRNGNVWIHNYPRCFKYNISEKRLESLDLTLRSPQKSIPGCLWLDQNDVLWLAYPNIGIGRYDQTEKQVTLIGKHAHTPLKMYDYGKDSLLIGTLSRGLFAMSKKTGVERKITTEKTVSTDSLYVNVIQKISNQRYWIGTLTGIYIFEKGRITSQIQPKWYDPQSVSDQIILSVCQDRNQNIWIGTKNGGVNYYNLHSSAFKIIQPDFKTKSYLGQQVKALVTDTDNHLWIGMEDGGAGMINIPHSMKKKTSPSIIPILNRFHRIYAMNVSGDELWAGSFSKGIYVYNIRSKEIKHYCKTNDPHSIQNNEIYCIYSDKKNRTWIGTSTDLYLFNKEDETFRKIKAMPNTLVKAMTEDHTGLIWLATANKGVIIYNAETGKATNLSLWCQACSSASLGNLSDIFCDRHGNIWISSETGGLYRYDQKSRTIRKITTKEGLPTNVVYKILEDDRNTLWISTNNGLVCIDTKTMKIVRIEYENMHLIGGQFISGSGTKSSDGTLYFGSTNGVVSFNSSSLHQSRYSFPVVITGISIFGQDATYQDSLHRTTDKSTLYTTDVYLSHNESTFNISFSAMDYERENKGYYIYMMQGVDHNWIKGENLTEVSYHGLNPGNYIFKIKYSPDGNSWEESLTELKIHIAPPVWRTVWAYLLYTVCILIILGIMWRRYVLKKERRLYYQKLNWEREKKEEIYQAKINFFTNVAHEIRTPLTLIKAPIESITSQNDCPDSIKENLSIVEKNIEQLHLMVNQLLDFRRIESDAFKMNPKNMDISILIGIIADSFKLEAERKGITMNTTDIQRGIITLCDEDALTVIINNLIGNAVKYAATYITVSLKEIPENKACLKICNDGPLIPDSLRNQIFDPFVRNENHHAEGFGIGLALTMALSKRLNINLMLGPETNENVFELHFNLKTNIQTALTDNQTEKHSGLSRTTENEYSENENKTGQTLLLVDDYQELLEFMARQLGHTYHIVTASNGTEAINSLRQYNIDLVISDVMMPGINGYELCKQIKDNINTCHIPVILLTAKTLQENKIEGIEKGADAYIDKPFSMDYLKSWIKGLLDNRQRIKNRISKEPVSIVAETDFMPMDQNFINDLKSLIINHIDEEDLNIDHLAEAMNMSRSNFYRKMKGLTDLTPGEFISMIRLDHAAYLLKTGGLRVNEVCSMVGFKSLSHFSRSFQKKFGVSPKNYR